MNYKEASEQAQLLAEVMAEALAYYQGALILAIGSKGISPEIARMINDKLNRSDKALSIMKNKGRYLMEQTLLSN